VIILVKSKTQESQTLQLGSPKNENYDIYSPLCCSKPVAYEFLCSVELLEDILKNVGLITQLMVANKLWNSWLYRQLFGYQQSSKYLKKLIQVRNNMWV